MRTFGKSLQWISLGYCGVLAALAIYVGIGVGQDGISFAAPWLFIISLPLSLVISLLSLNSMSPLIVVVVITALGLVQGAVLWLLGRLIRRRG
ncbi:SCO4225 family membrane protein [Stackebrandtia nassauensis]|uniref:Uncharacterized protein n=1 Tax=Stackebrandtia nassauensis (strain DSM 44728 / CIP 108903 / NRRL B-16338 / NBRC 102104 / LLR-40K-21) TaxID=446470 RepID=D3QAH4_STANL|nr:hypothetical protein [Stackebrandtia nassauensis]ADD42757.1 hypothetical protein Snas_3086 [Stackebrandtia nassauensis DSM 44728]